MMIKDITKKIVKFVANDKKAMAFQPGSHYILMDRAEKALPEGSIIKRALKEHKTVAAWGANGPDLGLIQLGELFGYSPWSCEYHYFKGGEFAAEMLKLALKRNNLKEIAFAAAWLTHLCGDLGCHGIFVNPECGVYLDNPDGRPLHMALEKAAEPYVWVNMGGYTADDYKKTGIANHFCDASELPFDLIIETSNKVYGNAPTASEIEGWVSKFHLALKTGVGYKYTPYHEAYDFLNQGSRIERLENGFYSALNRVLTTFTKAEQGDFSEYKNRWNMDVGRSDSPISNLKVVVTTGTKFGAGTDDYVHFGMKLKDGTTKEWALDNGKATGITVNDFEAGNADHFYLYIDRFSNNISPENIESVYVRKEEYKLSFGHDWYLENVKVFMNGVTAVDEDINKWIDASTDRWEKSVSLSHIPAQPDGPDPKPVNPGM